MYEITIKIEKLNDEYSEETCSSCADSISIDDEPIKCRNCNIEIVERDGNKLFYLLEKGLCKKCDRLNERLQKAKELVDKKKKQIVEIEYKLYTLKHLKC